MSWAGKEAISQAVQAMLRVNMELKSGEALLVVTDVPRAIEWQTESQAGLQDMLERAVLARLVADIAAEQFPDCSVSFLPFPCTGQHGTEPDEATATRMHQVDAVIALTTYSLSHTSAREKATQAGVRLASMPGFEARMFEAEGPLAADYRQIARDGQVFAALLTAANSVAVRTPYGTDLHFSVAGRQARIDNGLFAVGPERWGNLPAGEVYIAPCEGSGEGQLVVPAGWYAGLTEDLIVRFQKGEVVGLWGGGAVGDQFRQWLDLGSDDPTARARRNLAELGIGTNPNARRPDNVLEAEKIKGTVHIAVGDNAHMGGQVESDLHEDWIQPQPDLVLDGVPVIVGGAWNVREDHGIHDWHRRTE